MAEQTLFVVAVALSRHNSDTVSYSITQSWGTGTREAVIVHALEYARKERPDFAIDQWIVGEVPLPLITIDDGARTAPRYAAEALRDLDPGRSGLIQNLERLAHHLDACAKEQP